MTNFDAVALPGSDARSSTRGMPIATRLRRILRAAPAALAAICTTVALVAAAHADYQQQGGRLIGTGAVGHALQGSAVAVSADGTTMIVGGPNDNSGAGAAWIFTRTAGVWTQQGAKLFGTGAVGAGQQGQSVALSADGNTAVVGAPADDSSIGAVWVWTRSNGAWSQQGAKLIGSGAVGAARQGTAVAVSGDGNTALWGGTGDSTQNGASWVFTRSAGTWTQQGSKLLGAADISSGPALRGGSVALSTDGNTALIGGVGDAGSIGAAWVFTRSGGIWTQQGAKLVGSGAASVLNQTLSVALSGDGNTAMIGRTGDNSFIGATWAFTRTNGVWTQQGGKLIGTGSGNQAFEGASIGLSSNGNIAIIGGYNEPSFGAAWMFTRSAGVWTQLGGKLIGTGGSSSAYQGFAVALSGDGGTVLVGGPHDSTNVGAVWAFVPPLPASAATHDFNGDGQSDIVWRDGAGNIGLWLMNGATISSSAGFYGNPLTYGVVGQRDFDGDGKTDLLWRGPNGETVIWFFNGLAATGVGINQAWPTSWSVAGTGDFDGDGKGDILWRNTNGDIAIWLMNGSTIKQNTNLGNLTTAYTIVAVGDFDGDGKADIMFRDTNAFVAFWLMNGTAVKSAAQYNSSIGTAWSIVGVGDFNGDGKADIVFRDTSSYVAIWIMNGTTIADSAVYNPIGTVWSIVETGDYNHDGKADIVLRDTSAHLWVWTMNGKTVSSAAFFPDPGLSWSFVGQNAD